MDKVLPQQVIWNEVIHVKQMKIESKISTKFNVLNIHNFFQCFVLIIIEIYVIENSTVLLGSFHFFVPLITQAPVAYFIYMKSVASR